MRVFQERVQQFEQQYIPDHIEEVAYIKDNWLDPYKEKLVKAWVDQHTHFGNVVTSRVEGIHALLKSHLKKSTLDLFEAWRAIKHALLNQLSELQSNQAKQQIRIPLEFSNELYSTIRGWVSHEALRKVEEQRKLLQKTDPPPSLICTGSFTRSFGLPCLHQLQSLQEQKQVLLLSHFHSHWHLQRTGEPQHFLEPLRQEPNRILTNSRIPQSSTQREPSAFERIEQQRKTPTCTRCHETGHTRASKTCKLRHEELLARHGMQPSQAATVAAQVIDLPRATAQATKLPPATAAAQVIDLPRATAQAAAAAALTWDHPEAVYQRYIDDRATWYKTQPQGNLHTNQLYRKAKGLPARHNQRDYSWREDWKQMGQYHKSARPRRPWTKEEKMAYLDFSAQEDSRVEAAIAGQLADNHFHNRRGVSHIWDEIEADSRDQAAFYSAHSQPQ